MSLKGVNAEYTVKKLYELATATSEDSKTFESMWGYSLSYLGKVESGRVRIRITKMSASDFLAAFGKNPEADEYETSDLSGYSISGYLEKWHNEQGWVQCLDWLGEPEASNLDIEKDLLNMFKSFVTGIPVSVLQAAHSTSPYSGKPKSTGSSIDFSKYIEKQPEASNPTKEKKDDSKPKPGKKSPRKKGPPDDDLDWI